MNKLILVLMMIVPILTFGQRSMNDFMQENCDVVWFGLDFTNAKMIGSEGFNDPVAIKEDYFNKWNHLMISEGDKYNWQRALLVSDLKFDYEMVDALNESVKVKSLVINKSYSISEEDIAASVKQYNLAEYKDGVGVIVVVESFDKIREQGIGHITFFDISSKTVLYSHKVIGKPRGFGFRNYWAGAIYGWIDHTKGKVMKDIRKKYK